MIWVVRVHFIVDNNKQQMQLCIWVVIILYLRHQIVFVYSNNDEPSSSGLPELKIFFAWQWNASSFTRPYLSSFSYYFLHVLPLSINNVKQRGKISDWSDDKFWKMHAGWSFFERCIFDYKQEVSLYARQFGTCKQKSTALLRRCSCWIIFERVIKWGDFFSNKLTHMWSINKWGVCFRVRSRGIKTWRMNQDINFYCFDCTRKFLFSKFRLVLDW